MIRLAITACVLGVLVAAAPTAMADQRLVLVVAKGSPVKDISRADLRHCFLSDHVSVADTALVPFNAMPNSPDRMAFDREILGMSPDEVGRFWVDRKVRGQSSAPRSLPSAAHVAKVAAKFPSAIGYLPADQLTSDIQAVSIDGIAYTDARYHLSTP